MKNIKSLLNKRLVGKNKGIDEKAVEGIFFKVLEKELPNISRADALSFKFKDKKIYCKAAHPAISSEIWRKKERLKKELNEFFESEIIEEIKVK
jgi:hypothetical protein